MDASKRMVKGVKAFGKGTCEKTKDAVMWPVEAVKAPGKKLRKQSTSTLSKSGSTLSDVPSDGSGSMSGTLGKAVDGTMAGMKAMTKPVTASSSAVSGWVRSRSARASKEKGCPVSDSFNKPVEEQWKVHSNSQWNVRDNDMVY